MPYSKVSDLPSGVKDNLPSHGANIYLNAFNSAKQQGKDDSTAAKIAWGAVKNKFHQGKDGKWVSNSNMVEYISNMFTEVKSLADKEKAPKNNLIEFSMYITKATLDSDGRMIWAATGSDTGLDSFEEQMSLRLYKSFLDYIKKGVNLPIYLSLAHYPRLNGQGEAGIAEDIYIDGNTLKGKGYFTDSLLGRKVYNAIRKDRRDNIPEDNRVRISIGFYDRMHQHSNGVVWEYKSGKPCAQCALGIGGKTYLEGILEHFAVTRVPVNKRTDIVAKSKGEDMTTRYEDAMSIVQDSEVVDKIEKSLQNEMHGKAETDKLVQKGENTAADLAIPDLAKVTTNAPTLDSYEILNGLPKEKVMALFAKMESDGKLTKDELSDLVNSVLNDMTNRSTVNGQEVQSDTPEKKKKSPVAGTNAETKRVDNVAGHKEMSLATEENEEDFIELVDDIDDNGDIIEKAEARKDVDAADKKRAVKKYGNVTYADPTNKKYPIDTVEHIRAAWNYINKEANAAKYGGKVGGIKAKIVAAWKKKIDKDGPPSAQKSNVDVEKCCDDDMDDYKPLGGATTLKDAQNWINAQRLESNVYQVYSMFGALAQNILTDDDNEINDKLSAMQTLLSDFSKQLDPKELIKMSQAEKVNKADVAPSVPAGDGRSNNDTQPDSVKLLGAMQELIDKVNQLLSRPASVATVGTPVEDAAEPKGTSDQPLPSADSVQLATENNQRGPGNKYGNADPDGSFDENSPIKGVVSDFSEGMKNAVQKSGEERAAALQEVINKAGQNMKKIHEDLAVKEKSTVTKSEGYQDNVQDIVNRSLVPMQANIAELTDLVKGLVAGSAANPQKKTLEVPKMKSIVNPLAPTETNIKKKSIMDIATQTTFGTLGK